MSEVNYYNTDTICFAAGMKYKYSLGKLLLLQEVSLHKLWRKYGSGIVSSEDSSGSSLIELPTSFMYLWDQTPWSQLPWLSLFVYDLIAVNAW